MKTQKKYIAKSKVPKKSHNQAQCNKKTSPRVVFSKAMNESFCLDNGTRKQFLMSTILLIKLLLVGL
jgi:hypothetical protein